MLLTLVNTNSSCAALSGYAIYRGRDFRLSRTVWRGVRVRDLLTAAGVHEEGTHLMGHAEFGYTANIPLDDATRDEALVVWEFDNQPIEPIHGGPVRLLIPNLYFWKSPKWLRGLEVMNADKPGFWERNGYHMYGDPFLEQRHWGD